MAIGSSSQSKRVRRTGSLRMAGLIRKNDNHLRVGCAALKTAARNTRRPPIGGILVTRSVWVLLLCGGLLCGSLTFAATRRPMPTRVESEYPLSLRVSDSDIWLGAPGQGFAQASEVVVRVLDAQGQPADSVPVE
jgi:hypothetical protein